MTIISLIATDQLLTVALQPKVASGDKNSVELNVEFDHHWDGYGKSAVFFTENDKTVFEKVLKSGKCTVPAEVLEHSGTMYIGVRGTNSDNNEVKTSTLIMYRIDEGAPAGDGIPVEPTADVYQQILTAYGKIDNDLGGVSFRYMTKAEYDALDEIIENCVYIITDGVGIEDIETSIAEISGKIPVIENALRSINAELDEIDSTLSFDNTRIEVLGTEVNNVSVSVLETSKYLEDKISLAEGNAKSYTDDKATSTLKSAESYADTQASKALSSAKSYANDQADTALLAAKAIVDEKYSTFTAVASKEFQLTLPGDGTYFIVINEIASETSVVTDFGSVVVLTGGGTDINIQKGTNSVISSAVVGRGFDASLGTFIRLELSDARRVRVYLHKVS